MSVTFKAQSGKAYSLPATLTWPDKSVHVFDDPSIWAVQAAMAANRPLLVRGEPGVGKSQLARAVAHVLKRPLLCEVVHARCECEDLLFRFDAVARLAKAQVLQAAHAATLDEELAESRFLTPGVLWWAFDWNSAKRQAEQTVFKCDEPKCSPEYKWEAQKGCVVLIDEIDKADSDVPNALLEALGNGGFHVPYSHRHVTMSAAQARPVVVITTNEERELPPAFVRRCFVLHMRVCGKDEDIVPVLVARGRAHFPARKVSDKVCEEAAKQLAADRKDAEERELPLPGFAEYLDVLRALSQMHEGDESEQLKALGRISGFAFRKPTWGAGA